MSRQVAVEKVEAGEEITVATAREIVALAKKKRRPRRRKAVPTVNDMATLLAHAMRRPPAGKAHRPRRIHVRGHPQWRELFPHLDELGIKGAVHRELPKVQQAYQGYLRQQRDAHRRGMVKPTAEQQSVEKLFP